MTPLLALFAQALLAGVLLALGLLVVWRLAQRVGLLLPRRQALQRSLLCVRALDLDKRSDRDA